MSDFSIRAAGPDDREWISKMFRTHRDLAGAFYWSWQSYLKCPERHKWLLACHTDSIPVGTIHFFWSPRKKAWCIAELMVLDGWRRHGIGKLLLAQVPAPMVLTTNDDNVDSNAFYTALGFSRDGVTTTRKGRALNIYRKDAHAVVG